MKRLQTRAAAAALSALLLTADCMHFTQTRIATIDSFPVLFMMVMFLTLLVTLCVSITLCEVRRTARQ